MKLKLEIRMIGLISEEGELAKVKPMKINFMIKEFFSG